LGRRRRRKVIRTFKRTIPKVYVCPQCGKRTVTVQIVKEANIAHVACGACKTSGDVTLVEGMTAVDAYCAWFDEIASGKRLEEIKRVNSSQS